MIEKHYAAHIKTSLDTQAINRRRLRPRPAKEQDKAPRRARRDREDDGESAGAG
jgi:hypothetical protein